MQVFLTTQLIMVITFCILYLKLPLNNSETDILESNLVKKPKVEQSNIKSSFKDDTVSGMMSKESSKRNIFRKGQDEDMIKRRKEKAAEQRLIKVMSQTNKKFRIMMTIF